MSIELAAQAEQTLAELAERFEQWRLNEVDLRAMLERARSYRQDIVETEQFWSA